MGLNASKGNCGCPKTEKKKSRKKPRMRVRVYAGHAFSTAGAKGFKKGCNALMRPREKVERRADQLCEGAGPRSYIGLYQRGWSHPIRGCVGAVGALCNFVRPTTPNSSPCGAKRPNNSSKWGSGCLDWLCIVLNSFILMFSKYGGVLWNMFL